MPAPRPVRRSLTSRTLAAACIVGALLLAGCSPATSTEQGDTATGTAGQAATLEAGWAKAGDGMTSVFGTLRNDGPEPLVITGGSSPAAGTVEMHTMQDQGGTMVMVEQGEGFTVPAGGSHELTPGADHVMLLDLTEPLRNGEEIELTLTSRSGESFTTTLPVREFSGADEDYVPDHAHDGTTGH